MHALPLQRKKARPKMDEREADYLRQQVRELQQANHRWKALAIISVCVLALLVLAGGATLLMGGVFMTRQMRMEAMRARDADMQARMQAEQAMQAEMDARRRADEAAGAGKR
jgi:hypothetical protein